MKPLKSLIVGLGIGRLYESQLRFLGAQITTVDSNPEVKADYLAIQDIPATERFDTAHICTPNFLHETHARLCAERSRVVMVDKPGLRSSTDWLKMVADCPDTRFMMVKNNQWREQIIGLGMLARKAKTINIIWNNCDRVPKPGSWFTTKALAWGGVSRDLLPHSLSWVQALFPDTWEDARLLSVKKEQKWQLSNLTGSDYGEIVVGGTYDVDDRASMEFILHGRNINLRADWRTDLPDARYVELIFDDTTTLRYEFGLCPEYAYRRMVQEAFERTDDNIFWRGQLARDVWIHKMIGKFDE